VVAVLDIERLHLATLDGVAGRVVPVHGFVVRSSSQAVLVDTGVGGPQEVLDDWRAVNVSVADALAELDMSPADIGLVINTHLHFDHCGQNAVFKHAPFYVQRAELARMKREEAGMWDWHSFMDAQFELLDGDAEIMPGLSVMATPGHTVGHQCVVVNGTDVLIGDAAYTSAVFSSPELGEMIPGQAADLPAWQSSLARVRSLAASRLHFCHDTEVVHQ
jgi:N-acyl homoserine lactone hydrolase